MPSLEDLLSVTVSLQGLSYSSSSSSLRSCPFLCILLEISLSITTSMRFIRCSPSIKLTTIGFFLAREIPSRDLSSSFPVCILPSFLRKVFYLSCSFYKKEDWVCRSLWYFRLIAHVSIHGGGWLINHQSFPSLTDSFL
jgi:hypothetical protein